MGGNPGTAALVGIPMRQLTKLLFVLPGVLLGVLMTIAAVVRAAGFRRE